MAPYWRLVEPQFAMRKIFRDDRDFVEDEEQESVGAQEDAVDAADQGEVEGEEFAGAFLDVP